MVLDEHLVSLTTNILDNIASQRFLVEINHERPKSLQRATVEPPIRKTI